MNIKPLRFLALRIPAILIYLPETIGQSARRGTAVERMRELLRLPKDNRPLTPEVLASLAPRAVLVVGRDQDQGMPVEGLRKLEEDVKSVYARRGVPERFNVYLTAGDHTYTEEMFTEVSQWFQRFLKR